MGKMPSMSPVDPTIRCRKCGEFFVPDPDTFKAWICPKCQARNSNLGLRYVIIAAICIPWVLLMSLGALSEFGRSGGPTLWGVLFASEAALSLLIVVFVIWSKAPWAGLKVKALIAANYVLFLIHYQWFALPFLLYIVWLFAHASGSCKSKPMNPPTGENEQKQPRQ
jgi:hypothetical protein